MDASSNGILGITAGESVARLVHDQAQDVGKCDQPRLRGRTREEGSGSAGRSVTTRCSGQTARTRDLLQHRRQDVAIPAWRGPVVRLRNPECVAQRNSGQHGRTHGSASREVCQARPLQGQDEAVVDAETVAYRPQRVAGGRKLAIQRDSNAILEDGDGRNQRPQQRARNHRFACAE